ncbi:MAG: Sarcoplasmic/endoplasmic reticulum calcium ATPase 3 [Marteilia pararefringens]
MDSSNRIANRTMSNASNKQQRNSEEILNTFTLVRYFTIGIYIGLATVASFLYFFSYSQHGPGLSFYQLRRVLHCHNYPELFSHHECTQHGQSYKMYSLALSTMVCLEMLNALNSYSDKSTLLNFRPQKHPFLVAAIILSMLLHYLLLEVPWLAKLFKVESLSLSEWLIVLKFSFPVVIIDELFKIYLRYKTMR